MRTMTGIQWTDDHIYRYVTREFLETGDAPTSTTSSEVQTVQIAPAKDTKISVEGKDEMSTTS